MSRSSAKHQLLFLFSLLALSTNAQHFERQSEFIYYEHLDSVFWFSKIPCKGALYNCAPKPAEVIVIPEKVAYSVLPSINSKPSSRISINGNVLYDFNYRSYIDTPVSLSNLHQHFIQTNLRALFANQYPVDIVLRTRQSNNDFFRNYTDVNVFFNGSVFKDALKQKLFTYLNSHYKQNELLFLKDQFHKTSADLTNLKEWVSNEQIRNRYFEYKDLLNNYQPKDIPLFDSIATTMEFITQYKRIDIKQNSVFDGIDIPETKNHTIDKKNINAFVANFEQKQDSLLKLKEQTEQYQLLYEQSKQRIGNEIKELKNKINSASSYDELKKICDTHGLAIDTSSRFTRILYSLQSFGFGRSFLDYSELTVKNVSINGFHAEYKDKQYYAVAAGTVDYRFRDFIFNQPYTKPQSIALFRYGRATNNGNQLIFTAYTGRKQGYSFIDSVNTAASIFGMSVESKMRVNKNTYLTGEIAKSSYGAATGFRTGSNNTARKGFNISDESTLAVFLSFQSSLPKLKTKIRAQYRYQGAYFQSFTLFYAQNNVTSWNASIDQSLLKNKLLIQAAIRKNEFSNPYLPIGYRSDVLFTSVQASLKLKRLPFVMVAYMPSVQVMLLDNKVMETRYYSLIGSASHFYKLGKTQATALLLVSKFFNSQSDSGFVYYNARNIQASHSILGKKLSVSSAFSYTNGANDNLYVYDQGLQYRMQNISVGGGMKYNNLNSELYRTGYYGSVTLDWKQLKTDIHFSFEHGFLPGFNHSLITNDFGRVTVLKRL